MPSASTIDQAVDRPFALLLWRKDDRGEDDAAIFFGRLRRQSSGYLVEFEDSPPLPLLDHWHARIRPTPPGSTELFEDAEFFLSLPVADIKNAPGPLNPTGLHWPSEPA